MADSKITALTALTGANAASTDLVPVVDVSDTTMAASGTTKKMTRTEFFSSTPGQSIAAGTATTDVNALNITQTWNNAGVTFTGIEFNVTDTTSNAASLLMDLQVGGTSKFKVGKTGSVTSDSGVFFNTSTSGLFASGSASIIYSGGAQGFYVDSSQNAFVVQDTSYLGLTTDTRLYRDAANTLALRNSTNAQKFNTYGTYTSATSYHRSAMTSAKTTLSGVSGATVTATNLIPAGAFLIGVTTRVNTTCTTATGYTVGDGSDADLWGVSAAVAEGTATSSANFTAAGAVGLYTAAQSVVITATGGSFDGTGAIEVVAHYLTTEAD